MDNPGKECRSRNPGLACFCGRDRGHDGVHACWCGERWANIEQQVVTT